ncbi:MAG: hypothetical protein IJX16_02325 [Clostridia bacterium]|nr:hypothetical protein [Clostridia bacterium]
MDNLKNEQTEAVLQEQTEQLAEEKSAEVSFGKFKDANALLNAYNSLQAEFTKRCQRIKELEGELHSVDKATPTESMSGNSTEKVADTTPEDKDQVIREYLKDLLGRRRSAIVMDGAGAGVRTPVRRPKTVRAAGELAKELLGKN